jgi:hypothetical protein
MDVGIVVCGLHFESAVSATMSRRESRGSVHADALAEYENRMFFVSVYVMVFD